MYDIIAQTVGIIGSIMMIISYQCKKPSNLIVMQGFGGVMFSLNFLKLGAYTDTRTLLSEKLRKISHETLIFTEN